MGKIFDFIAKIGSFWWFIVLLYLSCFTFLLIMEYKSNDKFANSLICEERIDHHNYDFNETFVFNMSEKNDCKFIKDMNKKGIRLYYLGLIYFVAIFLSQFIWPYRKSIIEYSDKKEKK